MLVWTVCAYRKASMGEDEFHHYMSEKHAPLVREALQRHGITQYTMASFRKPPGLVVNTTGRLIQKRN